MLVRNYNSHNVRFRKKLNPQEKILDKRENAGRLRPAFCYITNLLNFNKFVDNFVFFFYAKGG